MFKSAVADVTLVGSLFGVDATVDVQIFLYAESLLAKLASEEKKSQQLVLLYYLIIWI